MTTEALRVSAGVFRVRFIGLWERVLRLSRRTPRRLRLCESLPLGDRRFVAVVEFDGARFLVGGTASSLILLSRLADAGGRLEGEAESESESESECNDGYKSATWKAATGIQRRRSETC